MPPEPAIARLWLLSALAAGALLLWLLALAGLGGWLGASAPAPPSSWTLPEHAPIAERLGAAEAYAGIGARPLFTTTRRPEPFVLETGAAGNSHRQGFILTGVLMTQALHLAILTPDDGGEPVQVHLGETLPGKPGWQLSTLAPRHAVFQAPEGEVRLELRGVEAKPQAPSLPAPETDEVQAEEESLNGQIRNQAHQARIEAIRRRVAERRRQQHQAEPAASSHSN